MGEKKSGIYKNGENGPFFDSDKTLHDNQYIEKLA